MTHLSLIRSLLIRLFPCAVLGACAAPALAPLEEAIVVEELPATGAPMLRPAPPLEDDGIFYVQTDDPAHPRVRYLDGQVALDASCAIKLGNKLSRKVPPAYVNGQPIGFC